MPVASESLAFLKNNAGLGECRRTGIGKKDYFKIISGILLLNYEKSKSFKSCYSHRVSSRNSALLQ